MSERDYYEVLEVPRTATSEEIKRSYRQLAMRFHPDRNPNDPAAEERFKEATEAYEILRHPDQRARYDRYGHAGVRGRGRNAGFHEFDMADALRAFMRDFGGAGFEDLFGGGRARSGRASRSGPLKGTDAQMRMRITLEEAATGVEQTIRAKLLQRCSACEGRGSITGEPAKCPDCGGSGQVRQAQRSIFGQFVSVHPCRRCRGEGTIITDPCPACDGDGRVREDRRIKVKIPAGVDTGNYLTLRGEGNAGPRGGPSGDLLIMLEVQPHERFDREGADVLMDLGLSFPQAALGTEIEVPTLLGTATLEIPPGTQNDSVLTLPGEGLPRLEGSGRGDQLVRVAVWVPTRLSDQDREHLEALAGSENLTPPEEGKGFWRKVKEAFTA